jgi:phenylpyruvate tautomerase PptA (4-oxalocrotonate tautomerase family)
MSNINEVVTENRLSREEKKSLVNEVYKVLSGVSYSNLEDILNSVRKKASENATYSVS